MEELARKFALERHGNQKYGKLPYSAHLDEVAEISSPYGSKATVIAYLHDVVEDTETTLVEINAVFGQFISDRVSILTDESGANRKERKLKTYEKMSAVTGREELALLVKAADRLANLRAPNAQNNNMLTLYKSEHAIFKESVYRRNLCEPIWDEIEQIING